MNKSDLIAAVQAKVGFKSIITDKVAPDSPEINEVNKIEKCFFEVATINADGTAGITYVFYLHNTVTDDAWFYNVEPESVDTKELSADQKKFDVVEKYLKNTFHSYYIHRYNPTINTAFADVYTQVGQTLVKSEVAAFKRGTDPVGHLTITV